MGVLFLLLFLVVLVIVLTSIILWKSKEKIKQKWNDLAGKLHCEFIPSKSNFPGTIKGEYLNHFITVDTMTRSTGNGSNVYTRFNCSYGKPVKIPFKLSKQILSYQISTVSRIGDITVGDSDFDIWVEYWLED